MRGDESYLNKYPDDAAAMAALIRQADLPTAVSLLQVWGSKQRDLGSLKALETLRARGPLTREQAEQLTRRAT